MRYEEIRAELAAIYHWPFAVIDGMSFEQIDSAMRGGKRPKGIPIESIEQAQDIARNWRRYWGL